MYRKSRNMHPPKSQMTSGTIPRDSDVCAVAPILDPQESTHGLALVLVGAPQPLVGIRLNRPDDHLLARRDNPASGLSLLPAA